VNHLRDLIIAAVVWAVVCLAIPKAATFDASAASSGESSGTVSHALWSNTTEPLRGKFNGKLVFSSDRHNGHGLSIWTVNADGSSPTRLTDDKSRTDRLPSFVSVDDLGPSVVAGREQDLRSLLTETISSPFT